MIFQDPMTSLNPVHKIGKQLEEAALLHNDMTKKEARARSIEMLKVVGIPHATRRVDDYPHQFSGGMRQRVMIAMALINSPDLLIADEPTTALDVTTQAQILAVIKQLQDEFGTALIMITHDLGVVAETADEIVVMYSAKVVEHAPVQDIFSRPRHPYTWGLMGSLPRLDVNVERLVQIPGQPPSLLNPPKGCRFNPALHLHDVRLPRDGAAPHGRAPSTRMRATSIRQRRTARRPRCPQRSPAERSYDDGYRGRAPRRRGSEEALPDHPGDHLPEGGRDGEGRRRRLVHAPARRDPRDRRRVRVRQVDARPLHPQAPRTDRGQDHLRGNRHHEAVAQ